MYCKNIIFVHSNNQENHLSLRMLQKDYNIKILKFKISTSRISVLNRFKNEIKK